MPRPQPPDTLARLAAQVGALDPFRLTALHDLVAIPGSLVLGLVAALRAAPRDKLWQASRIDEDWQAEAWGRDSEAEAAAAHREAAFFAAAAFWDACAMGSDGQDSGLTD
jgi:chaperone required for assembly of F1-ATPase